MRELKGVIDEAVAAGLVSPQSAPALLNLLLRRGVAVGDDAPHPYIDPQGGSDREYPRFIRGFHDILITIGVIAGLAGLFGIGSQFATFPAILVLSEVLVRRQRLALPAVVLAISFLVNLALLFVNVFPENVLEPEMPLYFIGVVAAVAAGMGLYHWRYRTPIAAALTVAALGALLLAVSFEAIRLQTGDAQIIDQNRRLVFGMFLMAGIGLFLVALSFDFRDPQRITTRSDIAFWLHLMAAPTILYMILLLAEWNVVAIACVLAVMTLVGLVIDRRTFITAGLVSLGYLIYSGIGAGTVAGDTLFYGTLAAVGAIVLMIGTLWMPLRRVVLGRLPLSWRAYLAPA